MNALLLAALVGQAGEAELRRFAALLERPESRARGVDRLSHLDPDALRRAGLDPAIVKAAEENAALAPAYGPPRLFSLDGREEDLDDVLGRLERASGLVLQRGNLPKGARVALRLVDASAFEALSELGRAASFWVLGVDGVRVTLQPGVPPARPRVFHGPVMIEIERLSRRVRFDFEEPRREFRVRLALWWEPHVTPLDGPMACALTRAVDDRGRSLLPDRAPAAPRPITGPRAGHGTTEVELRVPEPDARRLTLEGAVELRLPSRVESADFVRPGVVERPGVRVELRALEESGTGGMLASVRLTFEDAVRAEAYRPRAADVDFLTDHPGGALGPSIGPVRWREREVEYEVRQSGLRPEDVRGARVRVPSGAALKRVPFVFEGVEAR